MGDVVVYCHPEAPPEGHGALAVITTVHASNVDVKWLLPTKYILGAEFEPSSWSEVGWDFNSFEKIGHVDDF